MREEVTLHKILASTVRLETMAEGTQRDITELKDETTARLNAHAADLKSLNKTRDKVVGGAKVGSWLAGGLATIVGWFMYDG